VIAGQQLNDAAAQRFIPEIVILLMAVAVI
jgi:hypothetical protein